MVEYINILNPIKCSLKNGYGGKFYVCFTTIKNVGGGWDVQNLEARSVKIVSGITTVAFHTWGRRRRKRRAGWAPWWVHCLSTERPDLGAPRKAGGLASASPSIIPWFIITYFPESSMFQCF